MSFWAGMLEGALPCFPALLLWVSTLCLPRCLVPEAPWRRPPGPVDPWGQMAWGSGWVLWAGSFMPSLPHRMLQNNRLGGIPAEALWELPGLQSL